MEGHVYLIDDDVALCESIEDLLHHAGYQVRSWHRAADFLGSIPDHAPAVVLADMRMPGMTGADMHAALKQRGSDLPVIYVSGESTVPQTIQAMKQGAFDFLLKPFGRDELLRVVSNAIDQHRRQRDEMARRRDLDRVRAQLSPRQQQVHDLMIKGFGNREIAQALDISLPTAKQYKAEVMRKLGVRSLSALMSFGQEST